MIEKIYLQCIAEDFLIVRRIYMIYNKSYFKYLYLQIFNNNLLFLFL